MGSVISGIFGTGNNFQANTGGQDFGAAIAQQQASLNRAQDGQLSLAQALQKQASGLGPNPAQAALQQATDRNVKQGAGMIASQKSINPALAQRLIAQNTAESQQQAAGQGALMNAQQQIAAQGQLGGVYSNMGQLANQAQGITQNALAGINQSNANVAAANQQANSNIMGGLLGGAGALLGMKRYDGGKIDGQAQVPGDHPVNDTVPAMLSPGEIVVPRSKASNPKLAKEFIDQVMSGKDQQTQAGDEVTYADVLAMQKQLHEMIAKLKG